MSTSLVSDVSHWFIERFDSLNQEVIGFASERQKAHTVILFNIALRYQRDVLCLTLRGIFCFHRVISLWKDLLVSIGGIKSDPGARRLHIFFGTSGRLQ